ncbi:MAG: NAD(+)/NADH kinase, partial [Victivallales bacterium]|nr:NAD(+)/NADH kinase [Victivallales bacterium]
GNTLKGINDVVLSRKLIASAIRYRIWANGELLRSQVVADSLVVSTPFGSTGYFQSITHGNFQVGLGVAFNNAMDLYSHVIIPDNSQLTVELLRGPAVLVADNDPNSYELCTGNRLRISISDERTSIYGLDVFRCMDCYDLRKKGIN